MKKRNFLKVLTMSILMFSLTVSICSAETQTVSKEGITKFASYENGYRFDRNGWIYIHIEGTLYERSFQHGYLVAAELEASKELFLSKIDSEFLEEMK